MKNGEEALCRLLDLFDDLKIPYMLVGSFSSNYYGVARATKDADLVAQISQEQRQKLHQNLPDDLILEPQMSFEMVTATYREIISIPSVPFLIEIFDLSEDPHDQERFARRQQVLSFNRKIFLPTPEDVIIQKLRWCKGGNRGKDFDDVVQVLGVQDENLDHSYLNHWTEIHGTTKLLQDAKAILT